MSKSVDSSPYSQNSSQNEVHITIQDNNSNPSVVADEQLDSDINSNSSFPKKNFSNITYELENYRCDSPITMSYNGSRSGSYDGSEPDLNNNNNQNLYFNQSLSLEDIANITQENLTKVLNKTNHFKKYSKKDIEKTVEKYYNIDDNKFTNELEVLTTYVRGQKNLYIQSKNINQWKLNLLTIPTILVSFFITVLTPFFQCSQFQTIFTSCSNGIVTCLLAFIKYLQLETNTESFFQLANSYDELEISLDLTNSKLIFISDEDKDSKKDIILNTIKDTEERIIEIKKKYLLLVPEEIKFLFPIICHMNIFNFIKKMNFQHQSLIEKLKDIKNEINFINYKFSTNENPNNQYKKLEARLDYLSKIKNEVKTELIELKSAYNDLDDLFTKEIKSAEEKLNSCGSFYICFWSYLRRNTNINLKNNRNSVIRNYFQYLFSED